MALIPLQGRPGVFVDSSDGTEVTIRDLTWVVREEDMKAASSPGTPEQMQRAYIESRIRIEGDSYIGEIDGYKVLALRNTISGYWCGYAVLPKGRDIDAHGEVNYYREGPTPIHFIGVDPFDVPDGYAVYGFDCAHVRDACLDSLGLGRVYRDLPFVIGELEKMVAQVRLPAVPVAYHGDQTHEAQTVHDWGKDLAGLVKCLRCGGPAGYLGLSCQRVGGCKTAEERVGEPPPGVIRQAPWRYSSEPSWSWAGAEPRAWATEALAVAAWKLEKSK